MKELDITQWTKVGEGGNGATYINPAEPGVLLKESYLELAKADDLVQEFNVSKAIYELGEGKKSFAKLCHDNPEHLDNYARQMAKLAKKLHATGTAGTKAIPSMKTLMTEAVAQSAMLSAKAQKRVQDFLDTVEDTPTLLHGDFTFSNIILSQDKAYWIDLGRATHGSPYFDLGHFYLFCNIFGRQKRVQDIAHMTDQQMVRFWDTFAKAYAGEENVADFNKTCKRFAALYRYLNETRALRHDFRQHLRVLSGLAQSGKTEELAEYLASLEDVPVLVRYSANPTVDALIAYYAALAENQATHIDWALELPEELNMRTTDFCAILGNLVENALQAVEKLPEEQRPAGSACAATGCPPYDVQTMASACHRWPPP